MSTALLAACALSACGSTVATPTTLAGGGLGAPGTPELEGSPGSTGGGAGGPGAPASVGGSGGTAAPGGGGAAVGGPAGTAGGAAGGGAAPVASARAPRGLTSTTVAIGVLYADDGKKAIGSLGGSGDRGQEKDEYQALFDAINASGGILGRRIVPVWYEIAFGDPNPPEQVEAPACERFTNDAPVFAVLTTKAGGATDSFKRCLERKGVVHVAGNFTVAGAATYRDFPHYAEPNGLGIERSAAVFTPSMAERGWFGGWNANLGTASAGRAKVGVVTLDYPTFARAVDGFLVPELRKVADVGPVVRVKPYDSQAVTSAMSSAVLSFRNEGVTHVAFLQSNGTAPLLFSQQANSQAYYPRYGFTSQDVMPLLHEAGLVTAAAQVFRGAKGVGWWPSADTSLGRNAYLGTPAAKACLGLLAKAGRAPSTALQQTLAFFHCDVVGLLRSALVASGAISAPGFLAGLDKASYRAAGTVRSAVTSARRDGVTAVRGFQWDGECSCFTHDGAERSAP